ncbi:hypothetical protein [uncultured Eudoraea sp.]|uniref:hypothetical protein n=1 Tax=uncultured Eudoraea sp. TaxID=1035614 RepID=UPI00262FBDAC|nr:hypothetical protein [uncultured Eudoraea sp.]
MNYLELPAQPHPLVSYLRVGRLLHWSLILFLLESWFYWVQFEASLEQFSLFWVPFWLGCFLFSFVHIFLVIMDGWSRFQNYKRAKDLFFVHGFNSRIADMYSVSKCQRNAAIVAAEELGYNDEITSYFRSVGVKWYHYIPYFIAQDPLFLIRNYFWERTFLEKVYISRFDYRRLHMERAI